MIFTDIRKGLPFIILGIIASLCLIRGCKEIASPVKQENLNQGIRHLVFFDLKPNVDRDSIRYYVSKIEGIEAIKDLEIGFFKDVGDPRSLAHYEMAISMIFQDTEDYQAYQKHPLHLKLKQDLARALAAPPATYDFEMN